ncbi:MAG: di-trans,poly-cis-decaprenylcistransferase [Chloroflexi bacterium]|nr:di-trans,poly-cis-decaprenylcistransferase [Chloroflexota bacterium]
MAEPLQLSLGRQIRPLPQHVAIIMDGNGRWAKQRGLPRLAGHRAGTANIRRVIEVFAEHEVKYLTLYAFSTENWGRPKNEVRGLLRILGGVIDRETDNLRKNGVQLRHLGRLDDLSPRLQRAVQRAIELTKDNTRITVSVAFNYGSRDEIVNAVRQIVRDGVSPPAIDEELINGYLYTSGLPDPDLIIRTAGEVRLSNFLLWQAAYSEYYSTPTYWPDFEEGEIQRALLAYSQRQRRFGALHPREPS